LNLKQQAITAAIVVVELQGNVVLSKLFTSEENNCVAQWL